MTPACTVSPGPSIARERLTPKDPVTLTPLAVQEATPADTLVGVQSIDDAVSFDPAEGFELTTVQAISGWCSPIEPTSTRVSGKVVVSA